jgi:maleate isomerase
MKGASRGSHAPDQILPVRASIGIITPSASIVVERTTIDLIRALPNVIAHFSRTPVKGTTDPYPDGYDIDAMLSAAHLIADAKPDAILWAGSKGAKIGIEHDRLLCQRIREETGVDATTPTLALEEIIRLRGIRTVGLITPYASNYQARLIDGLKAMGLSCVAEAHSGISNNLAYASVDSVQINRMARSVAAAEPEAILAWCTNFAAGPLAGKIERKLGVSFYDATALGLWRALSLVGIDLTRAAPQWGSLFQRVPPIERR